MALRARAKNNVGNTVQFDLLLELDSGLLATWSFRWGLNSQQSIAEDIWLHERDDSEPIRILHYRRQVRAKANTNILNSQSGTAVDVSLASLKVQGSLLSLLDASVISEKFKDELSEVNAWGLGITSLELLSPSAMRRGFRGTKEDIGPRGGSSCWILLAGLKQDQKAKLARRLARFYPVDGIETTRKRAGWVDIKIAERFREIGDVQIAHIGDGFLRLLAICAIPRIRRFR